MTEDEIIQGMLDGSREAFQEFYAQTKETVEKSCSYFLGEDEAMVGAALGAYQKAFHHIQTRQKPPLPMLEWMSSLSAAECFPHVLRLRDEFETQTHQMEEMANKVPVLQEITQDPKERLSFMVRGEIDEMPDPHKEFLNLSELQGLSFLEISKRLGSSWSTVVTKLFQARQLLTKRVRDQLGL